MLEFIIVAGIAFGVFYFLFSFFLNPMEKKLEKEILESLNSAEAELKNLHEQIMENMPLETAEKMLQILDEIESHKIPVVPSVDSPVLEVVPVGEIQIIRNKIRTELVDLQRRSKKSKKFLQDAMESARSKIQ